MDQILKEPVRALDVLRGYNRVQLNRDYSAERYSLGDIDRLIRTIERPVITQHNEENAVVSRTIAARNHMLLVDSSRGQPISPTSWPMPRYAKSTGYAGGIGPDNLMQSLMDIGAVSGSGYYPEHYQSWVDIGSRLFTGFTLDVDKAQACLNVMQVHSARGLAAAALAADEPVTWIS